MSLFEHRHLPHHRSISACLNKKSLWAAANAAAAAARPPLWRSVLATQQVSARSTPHVSYAVKPASQCFNVNSLSTKVSYFLSYRSYPHSRSHRPLPYCISLLAIFHSSCTFPSDDRRLSVTINMHHIAYTKFADCSTELANTMVISVYTSVYVRSKADRGRDFKFGG